MIVTNFRTAFELSRRRTMLPQRRLRPRLYALLFVLDAAALLVAYHAAVNPAHTLWKGGDFLFLTAATIVYLVTAFNNNAYSRRCLVSGVQSCGAAFTSLAFAMVIILPIQALTDVSSDWSQANLTHWLLIALLIMMAHRVGIYCYVRRVLGDRILSEILIIDGREPPAVCLNGMTGDARSLAISPNLDDPDMVIRVGRLLSHFDRAVISCEPTKQREWALVLKGIDTTGEILAPELAEIEPLGIATYHGIPTLTVASDALRLSQRARKRVFDIIVSMVTLIMLAIPMLIIAAIIRCTSPGPIIFRQARLGCSNRMFELLKFRSMYTADGSLDGSVSTERNDKRVTRIGRILRATSIDELPQLINVLKGDMSLVGPRPHALGSTAEGKLFWQIDKHYWQRHALKPGITGLAQLRGLRGATQHQSQLVDRLKSDLEYVHGWSLMRDASILVGTLRVLMHRDAF